jgi:hypothetical protein
MVLDRYPVVFPTLLRHGNKLLLLMQYFTSWALAPAHSSSCREHEVPRPKLNIAEIANAVKCDQRPRRHRCAASSWHLQIRTGALSAVALQQS